MFRLVMVIGILLLVTAAVILVNYARDIRAARERIATGSTLAHTACGVIEYGDVNLDAHPGHQPGRRPVRHP